MHSTSGGFSSHSSHHLVAEVVGVLGAASPISGKSNCSNPADSYCLSNTSGYFTDDRFVRPRFFRAPQEEREPGQTKPDGMTNTDATILSALRRVRLRA
jgi:hypothetical protein